MYLYKSRHGIYYYRRNGMKRSLHTRKKREAVEQISEIITEERQRCGVDQTRNLITLEHAGAKVTIVGDSTEHELAIAQQLTNIKFTHKRLNDILAIFCQEKMADDSWTAKTAAENKRIIDHFIRHTGNVTTAKIGFDTLNEYKQSLLDGNRAIQTTNKYLSRVGTFCSWMERHGYLDKNYARGMQLKRTKNAHEDRERFTLDEVEILLSNLKPNPKKPHR